MRLVHLIISAYTLSVALISFLNTIGSSLCHGQAKARKNLLKVPQHAGFVITDDPKRFSADNLADLIAWSAASGALHVSDYDPRGEVFSVVLRRSGYW